MNTTPDPGARLERALEVFLAAPPSTPAEAERLLSTHPDLRDLLEPMLAGSGPAQDHNEERVFGDFRLVREIGRGGMGIVYEAWQRSLDRRVAVKVLAPALVQSPAAVARFRREAAAAGRLRHRNLVEVFGFGSEDGHHFFAMQLVEGESLHTCKALFREPRRAIDLAVQLVDALAHAHSHGLVHRDVKPANILVREDRTPMLTDFGIASDDALPSLTREGGFLGTLDYASPEQMRGEPVDARTDLWATGVILHELLTGSHPFSAATQEATIKNILTAEPPSVRDHGGISSDLAAVVGRALEKNRARRYASADKLLADLKALQQGAPVSARLPTTSERLLRWARREPWRAVSLASLLVTVPILTGTLGYLWANAPRIEAATSAEAARQREEVLAQAWWQCHEQTADAGLQTLANLPFDGDQEVAISRAFMLSKLERLAEARAALQPFAGETVELVRTLLDHPQVEVGTRDGKQLDAFDCFVRAQILVASGTHRGARIRSTLRRAVELASLAVALAPSPRISYLITLASAAELAEDRAAANAAERTLAHHFADSLIAVRVRARTLSRSNPEQALALLTAVGPDANRAHFDSIRGVAYESLGKIEEAVAANRAAITADPEDVTGWQNLGVALRKQKDHAESEAALRRAIEIRPADAFAWNALGLTLRAAGKPVEAREAFEHAIELRGDYGAAAYNLGNLLMAGNDTDGAITAFEQAVAVDPNDVKSVANLGNALNRTGRKQEAFHWFVRASHLAPNDLIPHFNLARTALELGLPELALEAARKARKLGKDGPNGLWIHADALLAQKEVDVPAALADARAADERSKGNELAIRIVLARALEASGDRAAAIAMLEAAEQEPRFQKDPSRSSLDSHLARMRAAK